MPGLPDFSHGSVTRWIAERFELPAAGGRLLPLEGLRGMSAILVFFVHFHTLFGTQAQGTGLHQISRFLGTIGHSGVDVFFALSGFIIYSRLLRAPFGYLQFIHRRIIRLYPVFSVVFVLYILIGFVMPAYTRIPDSPFDAARYLFVNFLMLPGIVPIMPMITVAWSLSYEIAFYLLLPLVIRYLRMPSWHRLARVTFWAVLALTHLAACSAGIAAHPRFVMFLCGILLSETIFPASDRSLFGNCAALAAFLVALSLSGVKSLHLISYTSGAVVAYPGFVLASLMVGTYLLVYFSIGTSGFLSRLFSWDCLRYFGNASYSYYLIHGPALHFIKLSFSAVGLSSHLSSFAYFSLCILAFAFSSAAAAALYLAVERPFSLSAPAPRQSRPALLTS